MTGGEKGNGSPLVQVAVAPTAPAMGAWSWRTLDPNASLTFEPGEQDVVWLRATDNYRWWGGSQWRIVGPLQIGERIDLSAVTGASTPVLGVSEEREQAEPGLPPGALMFRVRFKKPRITVGRKWDPIPDVTVKVPVTVRLPPIGGSGGSGGGSPPAGPAALRAGIEPDPQNQLHCHGPVRAFNREAVAVRVTVPYTWRQNGPQCNTTPQPITKVIDLAPNQTQFVGCGVRQIPNSWCSEQIEFGRASAARL